MVSAWVTDLSETDNTDIRNPTIKKKAIMKLIDWAYRSVPATSLKGTGIFGYSLGIYLMLTWQ